MVRGPTARPFGWALAATAAVALAVAPGAAAAATWRPIDENSGLRGTMVCSGDDRASARQSCFGLACRRGEPMHWMVRVAAGRVPARGEVGVSVDGVGFGALAYRATTAGATTVAEAAYSSVRHAGIADALKRGRRAEVTVSGLDRPVAVPLRNAAREIERTFARCGVPEGAPSQPMLVPPG